MYAHSYTNAYVQKRFLNPNILVDQFVNTNFVYSFEASLYHLLACAHDDSKDPSQLHHVKIELLILFPLNSLFA